MLLALLVVSARAEPELLTSPAVALHYSTEAEKYHQLQIKKEGEWGNVGFAVKGVGNLFTGLYPPGEYRVISPSKEWVMVWAEESEKNELDLSKWAMKLVI